MHIYQKTSETMVCLRGKFRVEYYDELERTCTESFVIEPGGINVAVSIPIGMWHTVHAQESGDVHTGNEEWGVWLDTGL